MGVLASSRARQHDRQSRTSDKDMGGPRIFDETRGRLIRSGLGSSISNMGYEDTY